MQGLLIIVLAGLRRIPGPNGCPVNHGRTLAGLVAAIIGVALVFNFLSSGKFIAESTALSVTNLAGPLGIIALGVTVLMIAGEFDLSVAATFVTAPVVAGLVMEDYGIDPLPALLLGLSCALILGFINGVLVVATGIPSFIVTLATLFVIQMFLRILLPQFSVEWNSESGLKDFLGGKLEIIPVAKSFAWLILLGLLLWFLMNHSRVGNWVYATGSRRGRPARAMGVPTRATKIGCFALCALLAGLAGIVQFADYGLISLTSGSDDNLMAIVATVIGGTSLFGGRGTVLGTLLGATLLSMFNIGLILSGVQGNWYFSLVGLLLLIAAIVNSRSQTRWRRGTATPDEERQTMVTAGST